MRQRMSTCQRACTNHDRAIIALIETRALVPAVHGPHELQLACTTVTPHDPMQYARAPVSPHVSLIMCMHGMVLQIYITGLLGELQPVTILALILSGVVVASSVLTQLASRAQAEDHHDASRRRKCMLCCA